MAERKVRRFQVIVTCRVELELDQGVIDAVDDGWRKQFYNLHTPEEIAAHIGSVMARQQCRLDFVDGFADQPYKAADITDEEWETEATEEVTPPPSRARRTRTTRRR